MSKPRPGALAVRAVNQYRRRDIVPYLGLRYYLEASLAGDDRWIRGIAPDLLLTRQGPSYFKAHHFKDIVHRSAIGHRLLYLPGPNEALAEAALLDACSQKPLLRNPPFVHSYLLSPSGDRRGLFQPYFEGLRRRQAQLAVACEDAGRDDVVVYTDIQKFYPSLNNSLARNAWLRYTGEATLARHWVELGDRIIADHRATDAKGEGGVLTGPMFTHFLANLVLRELDQVCEARMPGRYHRYVDDIVLVGSKAEVRAARTEVAQRLDSLGLRLHGEDSPKAITVPVREWLQGKNDFRDSRRAVSWMTFIGDLKRLSLFRPQDLPQVRKLLHGEGLRLPLRDYSAAVREQGFIERLLPWVSKSWYKRRMRHLTPEALLEQALVLRERYSVELQEFTEELAAAKGYGKKRVVPKLRYRAGRLTYLASPSQLAGLAATLSDFPELHFQGAVMKAVATGEVGALTRYGVNAAQAAANVLTASDISVTFTSDAVDEVQLQSLAVLRMNGVPVDGIDAEWLDRSDLLALGEKGGVPALMKSGPPMLREIACLHGVGAPRHASTLATAFDVDEDLVMDAVDQLHNSPSGES